MNNIVRIVRAAVCTAALGLAALAHAAGYPDRPIKLVVPYAPAGITDNFGRAMAEGIARELKQPVVVENRAGAGAIVGTGSVVRAPADGYTLLIATNGNLVLTPLLTKKLPYDVQRDLLVLAVVAEIPTVILTNPQLPVQDLRGFSAYGKANAGKINFASLGKGNALFLTVKKLETELGVPMTEVPYKGSSPSLTALMAGDVQLYVDVLPSSLSLIQAGKVKALAVPMDQRVPVLPDVPTMNEAGYAKFHAASWLGIAVPAATPPDVAAALQGAIARVARDENFRSTFSRLGVVMLPPMNSAQVDDYLKADRDRWGALIREHNISID